MFSVLYPAAPVGMLHATRIDRLIILIDCEFTLMEVPLSPGSEAVSIVAHESRVDRRGNAIPVHPITGNSAKLPDWLIREAEEPMKNNIKGK